MMSQFHDFFMSLQTQIQERFNNAQSTAVDFTMDDAREFLRENFAGSDIP